MILFINDHICITITDDSDDDDDKSDDDDKQHLRVSKKSTNSKTNVFGKRAPFFWHKKSFDQKHFLLTSIEYIWFCMAFFSLNAASYSPIKQFFGGD